MKSLCAIYSDGAFYPEEKIDLPDHTRVRLILQEPLGDIEQDKAMDDIYSLMDQRFETGETDLAERHNEHQP